MSQTLCGLVHSQTELLQSMAYVYITSTHFSCTSSLCLTSPHWDILHDSNHGSVNSLISIPILWSWEYKMVLISNLLHLGLVWFWKCAYKACIAGPGSQQVGFNLPSCRQPNIWCVVEVIVYSILLINGKSYLFVGVQWLSLLRQLFKALEINHRINWVGKDF